jgi:hypothetical protein
MQRSDRGLSHRITERPFLRGCVSFSPRPRPPALHCGVVQEIFLGLEATPRTEAQPAFVGVGQPLFVYIYGGKPTRLTKSWKRESERSGSRQGSILR